MSSPILTEADLANLWLLNSPQLKRRLACARCVASDAVPADVVTMQSEVLYSETGSGEWRQVRIVYPPEADPAAGRISVLTPLGLALLGASTGQVLECEAGRLRIENVLHQPERSMRRFVVVRE